MSTLHTTTTYAGVDRRPFAWWRTLGKAGRRAFAGAFGGYALDSYDYQVLPLGLVAIATYFHVGTGQAGLLSTVTLVVSAVGGVLAGLLADRIGRAPTLMITVGTYALFTLLCGFAPTFHALLVLRAFQGIGFGGEWAVGAILVAEYAHPGYRGRTVGFIQSSWAVGWGLSVVVYEIVFNLVDGSTAWRVLFWTGALPALLVLYIRKRVEDPPIAVRVRAGRRPRVSFFAIWRDGLARTTFFAALLATGVQGGYYTLATWLPAYLKTARHLSVVNTGGYLTFLITGAFVGYVVGAYLADLFGRRRTIALFAALSAFLIVAYTGLPVGAADSLVMLLGFPLGFCASAIFSGFGSFLAELYPAAVRGTGQGFTYNFGRAVGAAFPTTVGFLASSVGIGGAMLFGALAYGLAVLALTGLPETRGTVLA